MPIPDSAPGGTNASSYTVTGITNVGAYDFRLRATSAAGGGVASAAAPIEPLRLTLTSSRTLCSANTRDALRWSDAVTFWTYEDPENASVVATHDTITVTWDVLPAERRYNVHLKGPDGWTSQLVQLVSNDGSAPLQLLHRFRVKWRSPSDLAAVQPPIGSQTAPVHEAGCRGRRSLDQSAGSRTPDGRRPARVSRGATRPPSLMARAINCLPWFRRTDSPYEKQAGTCLAMPHIGSI